MPSSAWKKEKLHGKILYPLNQLKEHYPKLYNEELSKYKGREHILKDKIPILNCLWGEVLHFSIVNPSNIYSALREAGSKIQGKTKWYKIDPKKLQFGSKIDSTENEAINTYSVKEIISPEKFLLNNDLLVKLIGVKVNKDKIDDAIKFLQAKLKNQRVFMRFDSLKYDQENNLLCYLYLKNKTFINAHLIKNQLVDVDNGSNYKYKIKFLNLTK